MFLCPIPERWGLVCLEFMAGMSRTGPQGLFNLLNKEKQGGGFFPGYPGKADPHSVTEGPAESGQLGKPGAATLSGAAMAMKV